MLQDEEHPPQPGPEEKQGQRPTSDHRQDLSLSTKQAAQQLGVNDRTVRTYITERKLPAHQIRTDRGQQYQIYQSDLDAFKEKRDREATEGQSTNKLTTKSAAEESQALLSHSIQIIEHELERRSQALEVAQQTIERLAREAGHEAERSQELERQLEVLKEERDEWKARARALEQGKPVPPHKTHLMKWPQG